MTLRAIRCATDNPWPAQSSASRFSRAEDTDPEVALGLAGGNAAAWGYFLAGYEPFMQHCYGAAAVPFQDVPDLLQITYQRVFQSAHRFRPNGCGGCFRAWLAAIMRHVLADYFRAIRMRPLPLEPSRASVVLARGADGDDQGRLARCRQLVEAEFGRPGWTILCRLVFDGHSVAEVAKDMNLTQHALRKRKSRILAFLRARLQDARSPGRDENFMSHSSAY